MQRAIVRLEHAAMLQAFRLWLAQMWCGRDNSLEIQTFNSLEVLRATMLEHVRVPINYYLSAVYCCSAVFRLILAYIMMHRLWAMRLGSGCGRCVEPRFGSGAGTFWRSVLRSVPLRW